MKVLCVVATAGEAEQLSLAGMHTVVSGVGSVAAALATARMLAAHDLELVVSAGIAGAYPGSGLQAGDLAVSSRIIQADLGAQDGRNFLPLSQLGLSVFPDRQQFAEFGVWEGANALAQAAQAAFGPMLTLNTVTGTQARALELTQLYPGALTEGMEGAGVAQAAALAGLPVVEIRGISNLVGPRDRSAWRIREALDATQRGLDVLMRTLS